MERLLMFLIGILMLLGVSSCNYSDEYVKQVDDMFESFGYNDDYVLLTLFELVIKDEHYIREDIKYNGKLSNIVFLEQEGFYSYTYDEESLFVEFLFTTYENFEVEELGTMILPSSSSAMKWGNYCYWIRVDDPEKDGFNPIYYCWDVKSKTMHIEKEYFIEGKDYKYDSDNFRNDDFVLESKSNMFGSILDITDKKTNINKIIKKSILNKFEEGKIIKSHKSQTSFSPDQVYIDDRDFYITLSFGAGFLSEHHYIYVIKWNFDTEEVSYYTSTYFDYYQEWVDDFIILNS